MIVLDTDVVAELMRAVPSPRVREWVLGHAAGELCTTSVTLAEVAHGIARLPEGRRKTLLGTAAESVFAAFPAQVPPFDAEAARLYGRIITSRDVVGSPISGFDAQITAICLARGAALATRNIPDFEDTGVTLVDPWQ